MIQSMKLNGSFHICSNWPWTLSHLAAPRPAFIFASYYIRNYLSCSSNIHQIVFVLEKRLWGIGCLLSCSSYVNWIRYDRMWNYRNDMKICVSWNSKQSCTPHNPPKDLLAFLSLWFLLFFVKQILQILIPDKGKWKAIQTKMSI